MPSLCEAMSRVEVLHLPHAGYCDFIQTFTTLTDVHVCELSVFLPTQGVVSTELLFECKVMICRKKNPEALSVRHIEANCVIGMVVWYSYSIVTQLMSAVFKIL